MFARHWFPAAARVLAGLPPERVAEVDPGLRAMADEGAAMSAAEIMDAQRERGALATTLHLLLGEFDLLATPAVAIPAFAAGVEVPDPAMPPLCGALRFIVLRKPVMRSSAPKSADAEASAEPPERVDIDTLTPR